MAQDISAGILLAKKSGMLFCFALERDWMPSLGGLKLVLPLCLKDFLMARIILFTLNKEIRQCFIHENAIDSATKRSKTILEIANHLKAR